MIRFARELNSIFLRFQIELFSCIGITSAIKCININFNFFLAKTTDSVLHFLAREWTRKEQTSASITKHLLIGRHGFLHFPSYIETVLQRSGYLFFKFFVLKWQVFYSPILFDPDWSANLLKTNSIESLFAEKHVSNTELVSWGWNKWTLCLFSSV